MYSLWGILARVPKSAVPYEGFSREPWGEEGYELLARHLLLLFAVVGWPG